MKATIQSAIVAVIACAIFTPTWVSAEEKAPEKPAAPATEEPAPVAYEAIGTLSKDGEKIKFTDATGKVYLVTKNNTDKVTPFIDKKVKITGKSKSKPMPKGKPLDMIVYVNKIASAE